MGSFDPGAVEEEHEKVMEEVALDVLGNDLASDACVPGVQVPHRVVVLVVHRTSCSRLFIKYIIHKLNHPAVRLSRRLGSNTLGDTS